MFLVWMIGRVGNKRTLKRSNFRSYLLTTGLLYLSYLLLFFPSYPNFLSFQITAQNNVLGIAGALMCIVGVGLAIWSRYALGRNWSGVSATEKEGHELIKTGPYKIVRHPIYLGFLLAMIGFALTIGNGAVYLAIVLGFISILLRIRIEEKLMKELFPILYEQYSKQVNKLIPHVW